MLRESALAYGYHLDPEAIVDPAIPINVPGGNTLLRLVDAAMGVSATPLSVAHGAVIEELGPEALVDAAGVFGNFSMMNRIAEGTGIPLANQMIAREHGLITSLGLDRLQKH